MKRRLSLRGTQRNKHRVEWNGEERKKEGKTKKKETIDETAMMNEKMRPSNENANGSVREKEESEEMGEEA